LHPFLPGAGDLDTRHLRSKTLIDALAIGLPHPKQPNWKHALLTPLFETSFTGFLHASDKVAPKVINPFLTQSQANILVFVNGFYVHSLSKRIAEDADITLINLATLAKTQPDMEHELLEKSVASRNLFHKLNGVFATDGAFIVIPANYKASAPIVLYHFLIHYGENKMMINPQTHIVASRNSSAMIIEKTITLSDSKALSNAQTYITCEPNATLKYYRSAIDSPETFSFSHLESTLHESSHFETVDVIMGAAYHRIERNTYLKENNARCSTFGLMLANTHQHCDWVSNLEHQMPDCESTQLINAVVGNEAHTSFLGKITVTQHASKTSAKMENFNLLLFENGKADTAPQLEILTDDVQCTHGAAVGKLDEEAIFYLRSRGLSEQEAKKVLLNGFIEQIVGSIKEEQIQQDFSHLIHQSLAGMTKRQSDE
jgi:Fe-S cluster assembly protein SufD